MTPAATRTVGTAAGLYVAWTALTWWFEGRILTLLRPDAVIDRVVYALLVNLLVGVVIGLLLLAWAGRRPELEAAGFGADRPSWGWLAAALAAGFAGYALLGGPSLEPIVVLNAYAQVFVVSAAEIVVCFSAPAAAAVALAGRWTWPTRIAAALVSAVIFGVYHFAHSPPFDSVGMVAFLAVVGLVTAALLQLTRDALATILFHNFLGTLGVAQALAASGGLEGFSTPQPALLTTAAATLAAVLALDGLLLRRRAARD